ncbi:MAG TPA: hypothetical protein VKV74_14400 [Bryobacteraceae bacterium]|nr:hypothetical protein [Bryobacteraceae bacterium]
MPETYAPPEQRQPFENFRPYRSTRLLKLSDGDTGTRIVRDIYYDPSQVWSWTGQRPTVRLPAGSNENLRYVIDFTLADATFKSTGPVTLSFYVNDHLLDSVRYTESGTKHFEKPVPPEWVAADKEATVGAEIDKVWVAKGDGQRLGFILTSIGLKQE